MRLNGAVGALPTRPRGVSCAKASPALARVSETAHRDVASRRIRMRSSSLLLRREGASCPLRVATQDTTRSNP